ncbi:uncharacterized protein LOC132559439 isoform X2 [Ylistrum balloti]|uniref:uncharacterized protein LOC132559439 isoform X2 n=1 Tax=Ylistrum balloti TaxID=509963 RepID=UPI002905C00C|nr:uncharacterized protein LOC132559439 isoform X2 [Ylistrum balloti]
MGLSSLAVSMNYTKLLFIFLLSLLYCTDTNGIYLNGGTGSYGRYPKWNACTNASISFEFKTRQDNGLLMYTDDAGTYDFFELVLVDGVLRMRLNIVDGRDGSVEFLIGENLADYNWHKVLIQRKRMETSLTIDDMTDQTQTRLSYGSDFNFGEIKNNSGVYFGGMPQHHFDTNLRNLALPSVMFVENLRGSFRNVIYGNCSCSLVRGVVEPKVGQSYGVPEVCETRNPCGDCLCISRDTTPECKCVGLSCKSTYYHLPMDAIEGTSLSNPSGLDARVYGAPILTRGALNKALVLDRGQWIQVSGPGHRYECFGDLDLCSRGYTLGLWVYFKNAGNTKGVYMTNGGHDAESHGIAMTYKLGLLEFTFKKKNGQTWTVKSDNVLSDKWYHVSVTWKENEGLSLYLNGDPVSKGPNPQKRAPAISRIKNNNFIVGDAQGNLDNFIIDELKFWSDFKTEEEIKEIGPMYRYYFSMDERIGDELIVNNAYTDINGNVALTPGKIRNALTFYGDGGYVTVENFGTTCLGDVTKCLYGFTISFWIEFRSLTGDIPYFSSGPRGLKIFSRGGNLHAEVSDGKETWSDSFYGLKHDRWHFIEVTWSPKIGLYMFLDLDMASRQSTPEPRDSTDSTQENFLIGRVGSGMTAMRYPNAAIDEVEIHYGDRFSLLYLDLIQRGKPDNYQFSMDSMLGDRLMHPTLFVDTLNRPKLVTGKIGKAIKLNGEQQVVDFGEKKSQCFGNLDFCHHGIYTSLWFRPTTFRNNMYFFTSGHNGITLSNRRENLKVTAGTSTRLWETSTDVLIPGNWYFLEISWDPETGLEVFVDEVPVAKDRDPSRRTDPLPDSLIESTLQNKIYLGRGNVYMEDGQYGKGTFDELAYWYGPRDYLTAFGYLQRGKPTSYLIDFQDMRRGKLLHSELYLPTVGSPVQVPGVVGRALKLSGLGQYLDIGQHQDSCLGNLEKCPNGITIGAWMNFQAFFENMFIMSTGKNGLRMFHKDRKIYVTVDQDGKHWEVSFPRVEPETWNHMEMSWHPDHGLSMYVNNTLVAKSRYTNVPIEVANNVPNFYVGRANDGDSLETVNDASMIIDEMEIWFGRREELLAFNYLLRNNIPHETFSMEDERNGIVRHPRYTVTLANGAKIVPGKIGNAVSLAGTGQYVDLGVPDDKCLADINQCKNGLTMSLWIKSRELVDGAYFVSAPSYSLFYRDGNLVARFHSDGKTWEVSSPNFRADRWHNVEVSWTPDKGLALYLDGTKEDATVTWTQSQAEAPSGRNVYVGREQRDEPARTKALVDEIQYWYGPRDEVVRAGQIGEFLRHEVIPFDKVIRIQNGTSNIVLPTRTIRLHEGPVQVQGQHGSAIRVNGKSQYLDLGEDLICNGNLENCPEGITMVMSVKPEALLNNMYFFDSFPVSLYYRDEKLYATARTPTKSWTVSTPGFDVNEWHLVELSWHDQEGLTMYLDGRKGGYQSFGTPQDEVREWSSKSYVGRSLSDMRRERFADATFERMDTWNARKGYLQSFNLMPITDGLPTERTETGPGVPPINVTPFNPGLSGGRIGTSRININTGDGFPVNRQPDTTSEEIVIVLDGDMSRESGRSQPPVRTGSDRNPPQVPRIWYITNLTGILNENRRPTPTPRPRPPPQPQTPRPRLQPQPQTPAPVTSQGNSRLITQDSSRQRNTNTIRFMGDGAYVHYNFSMFTRRHRQMAEYTQNETFSLQFITDASNGLIWLDHRGDPVLYLALKDGYLVFGIDEGDGALREIRLQSLRVGDINDWRWHTFKASRSGRYIKFYIDNILVGETTTRTEIQFVDRGQVYLGGSPDTSYLTQRRISSSYNGALTVVEYEKKISPIRVVIVSLLQYIESGNRHGTFQIIRPGDPWTTRPPRTPRPDVTPFPITTPSPTTARPTRPPRPSNYKLLDVISIRSAYLHIPGYVDMRSQGSISFRFRTFEPRGVIFFTERLSTPYFCAFEIFDGYLYMVYNFGQGPMRQKVSDRKLNEGEWHDIQLQLRQNDAVVYVDGQTTSVQIDPSSRAQIYMNSGLYIGGLPLGREYPWYIWSRVGYNGCFDDLIIREFSTDMRGSVSIPNNANVQTGCTMLGRCDGSRCTHGTCNNRMDNFICDCMASGYQGQLCEQLAVVAGFQGTNSVSYYYSTTRQTHTNDIALRFNTMFGDAFLFQTASSRHPEYIKGELQDGRVKITFFVDGREQVYYTGSNLNDNTWHNLYLQRRANQLELWVDKEPHVLETLEGEDFYINIGEINFGSSTSASTQSPNYIGYLQNVYFDDVDLFAKLHQQPNLNIIWYTNITVGQNPPIPIYNPVTITSREAYMMLTPLPKVGNLHITFKFRTSQPDGVILFNKGRKGKFIAVELVGGYLVFAYNNGYRTSTNRINKKADDNQWHTFEVREVRQTNGNRVYQARVDDVLRTIPIAGTDDLGLSGHNLYLGGLSENMFNLDAFVKSTLSSTTGFMGCLASVHLNTGTPDFKKYASSAILLDSCQEINGVCPTSSNPCQNNGVCTAGISTFTCNCNLTAYAGPRCEAYPLGLYIGKKGLDGIVTYTYENTMNSDKDNIALGFMTYREDGILSRFDNLYGTEYIELRLENGFLVAEYDTGDGAQTIVIDNIKYNDGSYHVVNFYRDSDGSRFYVDGFSEDLTHSGAHSIFDNLQYVYIGGRQDSNGAVMNAYNGIIGGLFYNGNRFIDLAHNTDNNIEWTGDLTMIKDGQYVLVPPIVLTPPPRTPVPPIDGNIVIPPDIGGGGVVGPGFGGAGGPGGGGSDMVGIGSGPGAITGGGGSLTNVVPGTGGGPTALGQTGGAGGAGVPLAAAGGGGARAGALLGTILGTMAFMASLLWALWQCKPGMVPCFGGGGGGGGGAPSMAISSPTPATNLPVAQALGGGPGGAALSSSGAGGGSAGAGGAKVTILNGSASGGGGSGGGAGSNSAFSAYYSSSNATVASGGAGGGSAAGAGAGQYDATLRATGTFSNKGTLIGTPKASRAYLGSSSSAGGGAGGGNSSYSYSSTTTNVYNSNTMGGAGGGAGGSSMDAIGYGESTTADYDMAPGISGGSANYQSNAMTGGTLSKGYSTSTMSSSYNYQVQNVRTVMMNQSGHQMVSYGSTSSGAVTPGAAGDEVRVDCCFMTGDGASVVTGSSLGPPQVWDMQTGELLRIMKGDTVGSTNLHLACNDRLLVGAVHADLEINEFSTKKGVTNKTLQIWDFVTGKPLVMGQEETCSALCVMTDPDKVVFARSGKYGNGTDIIVWDLLGNQAIKEMHYDVPVGNNDYINYLALSQNDRYCVAGFTNSFDNYAEFVTFDVTLTSFNITEPNLLRLDANPDCTVILPRDEAVTGLRNGDLVIWSLRTGHPSRQLLSGSGVHAHSSEIKALAISEDNRYLVSASTDCTLKVWDMTSERQVNTLSGHGDEVWCVAISPDNEIVVSGSRDCSIRLWRLKSGSEICTFTTGVDVFYVTMSHDKGTIVALGDKCGARKLIMLQVVRSKVRRQISS